MIPAFIASPPCSKKVHIYYIIQGGKYQVFFTTNFQQDFWHLNQNLTALPLNFEAFSL
jgi:hypothetical protein